MAILMIQVQRFRAQFPLLSAKVNGKPLVYFDNGATTQKPQSVIDAFEQFFNAQNANVHRATHAISAQATQAFEQSRARVAKFISAKSTKEVIWTSGTTHAINLVAHSWGGANLTQGDEIILSVAEHHANIVPWQQIAKQTGAVIKVVELAKNGTIDLNQFDQLISEKTKLVALTHLSNVTGKLNPIEEVISKAKNVGAKVLIDGAQAISHVQVDVTSLDCDFYVFSAHKMFGPTGLGVLYGRQALLEAMPPYQTGGEMIKRVSFNRETTFNQLPFKFEPGTPNIAAVIAFEQAIELIEQNRSFIEKHDRVLTDYFYQQLKTLDGEAFLFEQCPDIPLFSLTFKGQHHQDVASVLDGQGVAVRTGHHCAMPLMDFLRVDGCLRVSLAPYNTKEEIDRLILILNNYLSGDFDAHTSDSSVQSSQNEGVDSLLELFAKANSWDKKHREIMLLGKSFSRMPAEEKQPQYLIEGCESKAWLKADYKDERLHFSADSDAKVVRGLLNIVLTAYNDLPIKEILAFDIHGYFEQLGLLNHLSPSRGNGLLAIVERIQMIAKEH